MRSPLVHNASGFFEVSQRGLAVAVGIFTLLSALVTITISYRTTQLTIASKVDLRVFEAAVAESRAAVDSLRITMSEDRRLLLNIQSTVSDMEQRQREMACDLLKSTARYCR